MIYYTQGSLAYHKRRLKPCIDTLATVKVDPEEVPLVLLNLSSAAEELHVVSTTSYLFKEREHWWSFRLLLRPGG